MRQGKLGAEWHWRRRATPHHRDWGQEDTIAPLAAALSSAWLSSSFLGSDCCPTCKFSVLQCKQEGRRALGREECHGRTTQVLFQVRNEGEKNLFAPGPKTALGVGSNNTAGTTKPAKHS